MPCFICILYNAKSNAFGPETMNHFSEHYQNPVARIIFTRNRMGIAPKLCQMQNNLMSFLEFSLFFASIVLVEK